MIYAAGFCFVVCIVGVLMTMKVGRREESAITEEDQQVANATKEHSLVLNPVFITYTVAALLSLGYIIFWMMRT